MPDLSARRYTLNAKLGFTLVEILLSIFLILAVISIFLVASGTYRHTRNSALQTIATKIASREIETLRKTPFTSLPSSGPISDPDLAKLPSSNATRTVTDYQSSPKIKQINIAVNWVEQGAAKNITLDTLISENGL